MQSPIDPQIAHITHAAGLLDIEADKQALDKSKNEDVCAFAQQMVRDHTSVNDKALVFVKPNALCDHIRQSHSQLFPVS